ncbi:MAG: protease complex subunit PrcB family protein [Archaeoglobaceae archaeon]|nr:protease complex subunit PrcB family protein [Archaeoglobaceae archaeon]MDW8128841.1 protease complex subunit PrcB family protein [Archaeoglobaceae archaeon]
MKWFVLGVAICIASFAITGAFALGLEVWFKTIAKGQYCNYYGEDNYVVKDERSFKDLMAKAGIIVNDSVNFKREMVIATFYGWKPTSGYDITIRSIEIVPNTTAVSNKDVMIVTVVKKKPAENCILLPVITAPYHIVKLPRFDGEVIFKEITVIEPCNTLSIAKDE